LTAGGVEGLLRAQDKVRPACFGENVELDFGTGGTGISVKGLSCGERHSSRPGLSVEDGAVEAALKRDELSVVDAVFVLEAPLPLHKVSLQETQVQHRRENEGLLGIVRWFGYSPIIPQVLKHVVVLQMCGSWFSS